MTAFEWFSVSQTVALTGVTVVLWTVRKSMAKAVADEVLKKRVEVLELDILRFRSWRHDIITPWQQGLTVKLEEHFVTRREYDLSVQWSRNRRSDGHPPR